MKFFNFVTQLNLKHVMLSKISQIQKDKFCVIPLICGILKKLTS